MVFTSRPKLKLSLWQSQPPGAASMRRGVKFPRTWHDGQSGDFNHGKVSASDFPIAGAVRQPQNAKVVGDIQIAGNRIKRDTRRGEVRKTWPSRPIEIRPRRRTRTLIIGDGKHMARRCR